MPEQVQTFFISLPGKKKSVGSAQTEEVYFSLVKVHVNKSTYVRRTWSKNIKRNL